MESGINFGAKKSVGDYLELTVTDGIKIGSKLYLLDIVESIVNIAKYTIGIGESVIKMNTCNVESNTVNVEIDTLDIKTSTLLIRNKDDEDLISLLSELAVAVGDQDFSKATVLSSKIDAFK